MGKNILFVDDEISILKSLKRSFFNLDYNIYLGNSGEEGLEILAENDIDIVVSDVKMPEMDGLTFLKMVKELYPSVDRIVLSGFVEINLVLKAIVNGVAFDYITKPWDNSVLFEKLDYIILMRERVNNNDLVSSLNAIDTLPTLENVYFEFEDAILNNKSFEEIARIAEKDIAISSKIIQLVNSAFYSKIKIGSVEQAINIMGTLGLKSILHDSSLSSISKLSLNQRKEIKRYNELTYKVNKLFIKLYETYKEEKIPDEYRTLGLTLYIGKVILVAFYWDRYDKIVKNMKSHQKFSFWEAEIESNYVDCTHIEIGAYFLSLWNFPLIHFQVIFNYMTPFTAHEELKEIIALLTLSKKYVIELSNESFEQILRDNINKDDIKDSITKLME